jgi:uncharacterized protein (DUF983 family)
MDWQRTRRIMRRALRLKCPACGEGKLYTSPFKMLAACEWCGMVFAREQGYFIGAIYVNVMATESLIFFAYLLSLTVLRIRDSILYPTLFVLALALPILFYHHARSIWLSFDYLMDPPSGNPVGGMPKPDIP